jgi:predicted nucleotidyltransferase
MKSLEEIKKAIKDHRQQLRETFKVENIALFGSYVRGDQNEKSDLDVLIEFREPVGFLFIHLADFLEELLGVEVDLVTRDAIKPNRWPYIEEELMYV